MMEIGGLVCVPISSGIALKASLFHGSSSYFLFHHRKTYEPFLQHLLVAGFI